MTKKLLSLAAFAVAASLSLSAYAETGGPIRLGFLTVKSGALAAGGKQMEDALRLFLKERNNTVAGRKIDQQRPAVAKSFQCEIDRTM